MLNEIILKLIPGFPFHQLIQNTLHAPEDRLVHCGWGNTSSIEEVPSFSSPKP